MIQEGIEKLDCKSVSIVGLENILLHVLLVGLTSDF